MPSKLKEALGHTLSLGTLAMPMTTIATAMPSPHYAVRVSPNQTRGLDHSKCAHLQVDGALHVEGGAPRDDDAISRTICRLVRVRVRARARDRDRDRDGVPVRVRGRCTGLIVRAAACEVPLAAVTSRACTSGPRSTRSPHPSSR